MGLGDRTLSTCYSFVSVCISCYFFKMRIAVYRFWRLSPRQAVASNEWVILLWGKLSSIQLLRGKQIWPMVLVVVSKSGSWEPRSAKPKATGLFVPSPKVREAAETAIAAWVIDSISGNKWSYYQFGLVKAISQRLALRDRQLFSSLGDKKRGYNPKWGTETKHQWIAI